MTVMPLAPPARRPTTLALLVVAVLCLALVGAALCNPWRLTALHPLASTGGAIALLTLGGALIAGAVLLASAMHGLHPRYLESFTPAVAACLGAGAAHAA